MIRIGSWAGQSSILWAKLFKENKCGKLICIDPWQPYISEHNIGNTSNVLRMENALRKNKVFPLFLHNTRSAKVDDFIITIRAKSADELPLFSNKSMDIIYVDGAHYHSNIIGDLRAAARLVKEDVILCGDDLEKQFDEVDLDHALENKEKDFITDPNINQGFHPGVTIAIHEFFEKRVTNYNGFWAMMKKNNEWEEVIL